MRDFKDKGYSLVETVIVLVMIVILSVISLVSVTIINTARAKQASTLFGDEVNTCRKRCMSMSPAEDPSHAGKKTSYGLALYYEGNNFSAAQVECYNDGGYKYVLSGSDVKVNDNAEMSSRVNIKFTGYYKSFKDLSDNGGSVRTDFTPGSLNNPNAVCIMFDKHGNCTSGYGKYEFFKKDGNKVATVTVRQNGSIEIK